MEKTRAIVVDDERQAVKGLLSMLTLFCPEVEVVGTASSVAEAMSLISESRPRLVFLDIELQDGSGLDLIENIPDRKFFTIFVTAFDHHMLRALRLNALDYLLKPIDPDDLMAAVARVATGGTFPDYSQLVSLQHNKIGVPGTKGTIYLGLAEIIRLESSNNYTYIHCATGKPLLVSKTIKVFEGLLPPDDFIRCHQRHIVNLDFVSSFLRTEGPVLVVNNNRIPVSRSNRRRVEQALSNRFPSL